MITSDKHLQKIVGKIWWMRSVINFDTTPVLILSAIPYNDSTMDWMRLEVLGPNGKVFIAPMKRQGVAQNIKDGKLPNTSTWSWNDGAGKLMEDGDGL